MGSFRLRSLVAKKPSYGDIRLLHGTNEPCLRNFTEDHMHKYPFIFSDERKYRIRRHLVFWIFWWIFQGFLYSFVSAYSAVEYYKRLPTSMLESLIYLSSHIFLAYALIYLVIPKFLLRQKYWHTAALTIICFLLTAFLSTLLTIFVIDNLRLYMMGGDYATGPFRKSTISFHLAMLAGLRGGLTVGGIAAAIKLMKYWYVKEQRNLQLQKESAESKLQLLKAQVHPHFLFNTLNNIYSYTQNTSPFAAKMITGLSELLRYMLYDGNLPLVPLSKELRMAKDYINLEQIRYGNKLEIHLDLPENTNNLYIAPLLLLPLVENCFKHGTSNILEHPWVNFHVTVEQDELQMKLINGKSNEDNGLQKNTGIGIMNVKKRLELLYPGRHQLSITSDTEVFVVNLKIKLDRINDQQASPVKETAQVYA